jgi:hypothetical protein
VPKTPPLTTASDSFRTPMSTGINLCLRPT